jgi:primosomal protein N' (replication factor Y)
MYARLAIANTGFKLFTYRIPANLESTIRAGTIVMAPFGKRSVTGMVMEVTEKSDIDEGKLKEIAGLIDPVFSLSSNQLALLTWLSDYYICPVGDVIKAALPPGAFGRSAMRIKAGKKVPMDSRLRYVYDKISAKQDGFNYSRSRQVVPGVSNSLVDKMIKSGVLYLSAFIKSPKPRSRTVVSLKHDPELYRDFSRLSSRRKELIEFLMRYPDGLTLSELSARGFSASLAKTLSEGGYLEITHRADEALAPPDKKANANVILNADQETAATCINETLNKSESKTFLLFGVTGSGKTQVYIEAARTALALGESVLLLLPEIALTPQAIKRFSQALNRPIGVWHSRITPGQRTDLFRQAKLGELDVVLGVRSAVFVPLTNLGLIVVDEEQDDSYKQSDPPPRYNAREAALMKAKIEKAVTILGSATPSMESFHNAQVGKYQLLRLPERYGGAKLPRAMAIDLRTTDLDQELWPLSEEFIEKVCLNVADGKQVIILLNRRGYSGILMCRACGYIALCPDCRVAQTYHKKGNLLRCHYCGSVAPAPDVCPECSGSAFEYRGIGTQKLEELFIKILGEKGILRMDSDTTSLKGALEKIITTFEIGEKPVLLGTKMVAKGHHFPRVSLVGVVLADAGLHLPDFRASEKVFQLLVQAAGRAGRFGNSNEQGEFIVQTYDPSSGILEYATEQNYEVFYYRELKYRKELGYPPFGKIIRLVFSGEDESLTRWAAKRSAGDFKNKIKRAKILGPAQTGIFRLGKKYHYQVILKGAFTAENRNMLKEFLSGGHYGRSKGVKIKIDVDPREMV